MTEKEIYSADWLLEVAKSACLRLQEEELHTLAATVGAELSELSGLWEDGEIRLDGESLDMELLREDLIGDCLDAEDLVSVAHSRKQTCFSVPSMLGEGGESS